MTHKVPARNLRSAARPAAVASRAKTDGDALVVDRRTQISAIAADLFATYGYEATSVRQIADRVGMLAGSLYNHFATKEDMLHEIMRPRMEQIERDNLKIAQLPADAERRLLANAIMRIRHYVKYWQFHSILIQEGPFFERSPDFAYVTAGKSRVSSVQASILEEGMQAGLFRPHMDTYLTISTISRMLSNVNLWHKSKNIPQSNRLSKYSLSSLMDFHFDCVLRLVRSPARLDEPIPREFCENLLGMHFGPDWLGTEILPTEAEVQA